MTLLREEAREIGVGLDQPEMRLRRGVEKRRVELVAQVFDKGEGTLRPGGGGDPGRVFIDRADEIDEVFLRRGVQVRERKVRSSGHASDLAKSKRERQGAFGKISKLSAKKDKC